MRHHPDRGLASYGGPKAAKLTLDTDAPARLDEDGTVTPTLTYALTLTGFGDQLGPSPIRYLKADLSAAATTGTVASTVRPVPRRGTAAAASTAPSRRRP